MQVVDTYAASLLKSSVVDHISCHMSTLCNLFICMLHWFHFLHCSFEAPVFKRFATMWHRDSLQFVSSLKELKKVESCLQGHVYSGSVKVNITVASSRPSCHKSQLAAKQHS